MLPNSVLFKVLTPIHSHLSPRGLRPQSKTRQKSKSMPSRERFPYLQTVKCSREKEVKICFREGVARVRFSSSAVPA